MIDYIEHWFRAFAFTLTVEALIVTLALPNVEPVWRRLGAATFAQVASHPAVWFIFPRLGMSYSSMVLVAEAWAVVSELLIYRLVFRELSWLRAFGVAALANGASYGLGLLLRALASHFGWGVIV